MIENETAAVELVSKAAVVAKELISEATRTADKLLRDSSVVTDFKVMSNDLKYIREDITEIKKKLDNNYVTIDQFAPVRNVVYGLVGILGVATIGAILNLILK